MADLPTCSSVEGKPVISATFDELVSGFVAWVNARPEVCFIVIEGYPQSGKTPLLKALPDNWAKIEIDDEIPDNSSPDVPWLTLAQQSGVVDKARLLLRDAPVVAVEGVVAGALFEPLLAELRGASRRIYVKACSMSSGSPYWVDGAIRDRQAALVCNEFMRSAIAYHAGEPENAADLILERLYDE